MCRRMDRSNLRKYVPEEMLIFNSIINLLYQVCTEDSVCAENDTIIDCDKTPAPFKRKIIECYPQGTKNTSNYTSNDY
jgi:hypothetical protein